MEPTSYMKTKLSRKNKKYSSMLERDTGIKSVPESKYLMVCNLGLVDGMRSEKIVKLFSQYSIVQSVVMVPGKSYCFVQFANENDAKIAFNAIHGKLAVPEISRNLYLLFADKMPEENFAINFNRKPAGLSVIDDFINEKEEKCLINFIEEKFQESGNTLKHRLVTHFGYVFNYRTNNVDKEFTPCERIPDHFYFIFERLKNCGEKFKNWIPNQLTINKYQPGQGIPSHIDTHSAFDDIILSLSTGSDIAMDLKNNSEDHYSIFLRRRSLLVMSDESRYAWHHGIIPRKYDVIENNFGLTTKPRGERISFTFRRVRENNRCNCSYPEYCDTQKEKKNDVFHIDNKLANKLENLHVHEVYDRIASHFSETRHKAWPNIENFVKSFEDGSVFVDVGCGNGKYFGINKSIHEIGCDRSRKLAVECSKKRYETLVCDCLRLPFRTSIADYCVCVAVIHHLSTEERRLEAVKEIARILRFGGRALIYVWAKNQRQDDAMSSYLKQRSKNKRKSGDLSNTPAKSSSAGSGGNDSNIVFQNAESVESVSLPIHVNRTQFKYDDLLVPWKLTRKSSTECSDTSSTTFLRYYHVFTEGELEKLCANVEKIEIVKSYYDQGNWCVMLEKKP